MEKVVRKWEVRLRLEFIETRLYWEGRLNRGDLVDFFGVSIIQASKDIGQYQELVPGNMVYDKRNKYYSPAENFEPQFISPCAEAYLDQLRLREKRPLSPLVDFWGSLPKINIIPAPYRKIDKVILKRILFSVREKRDIEIQYQSMSRPEPLWRWLTPHALSFDGQRWHVRSFCHVDSQFKDFLLSRIIASGNDREQSVSAKLDSEWHNLVKVKIAPHPDLSSSQKRVIEYDYGMTDGSFEIQLRKASLFYFLKNLNLENGHERRKATEQQIVLLDIQYH
jgi:predicted DNA-binding transcriptional regulator YafY